MKNLIFLDVETTGTRDEDRLCQVAYKSGEIIYEGMFKPPLPMTIDAMSVNHVTDEMLESCVPFKGSEMCQKLQELFNNDHILIAHNAHFDLTFLLKEGLALPKKWICTMKIAHHFDKEGTLEKHNLQYLRYLYKLKFDVKINPHEAVNDIIVLEQLFKYYLEHYTVEEMVEISARPILFKKMVFGKYKGEWFKDVAKKDLDYLMWMRRAMTLDENLKFTLEHYINNR